MDNISIVSISSLFQYYIFLSCIENKNNKKYLVLINNILINDEICKQIEKNSIKKKHIFLDLRNTLRPYKEELISEKFIQIYKDFFKKNLLNYKVENIFLRYKINFPESLLINQFQNAKLNFFEDGLGDYIIKENWTGYKKAMYVREKYRKIYYNILYFFNIKKNKLKYLLADKNLKSTNNFYEFHHLSSGNSKKKIIKFAKKRINIYKNLKKILFKESLNYSNLVKNKSILILSHPFINAEKQGYDQIIKELNNYIKIYNYLITHFPQHEILFKPHPSTTNSTLKIIRSKLSKYLFLPKEILSEIIVGNTNVQYIGSLMSSSLFYSKLLYEEKEFFYFNIDNTLIIEYESNKKTVLPIYNQFKIKKISI